LSQQLARRSLGEIYHAAFHQEERRERMFLASLAFFGGFAGVRALTHAIRHRIGPFHNLSVRGTHLHHLLFGITGLLGVGYLWLLQFGAGSRGETVQTRDYSSRGTSVAYGLAAALTLDEFALWLNLKDVYWKRQGRESVEAVMLFAGLLSAGLWGGPFLREIGKELRRLRL
jgi:hypothetical protein